MIGTAINTQTILRTIMQSVASVSNSISQITPLVIPPELFQRFASTVVRVIGETNLGIVQSKGIQWMSVFGLALGVLLTLAVWFIRRREEPEEEALIKIDPPPEVPPELPPEPYPISID